VGLRTLGLLARGCADKLKHLRGARKEVIN